MKDRERLDEELEAFGLELQRLPTPMPRAALVSRVRRLAHVGLAERADDRRDRPVLVCLLLFSWAVSLFTLLAVGLLPTLSWSVAFFVYAWISTAAVLVLLGVHVRKERNLA